MSPDNYVREIIKWVIIGKSWRAPLEEITDGKFEH